MAKKEIKYFDFRDLAFFLLSCNRSTIETLAEELKLQNSGSPYHDWRNVSIRDVLQALNKKLKIPTDKRKEVKTLLKSLGYIK